MFFARPRRRSSRRLVFSFDQLQARITPSDVSGMGDAMGDTMGSFAPVVTNIPDEYYEMDVPGTWAETDGSNSTEIDPYMMTVPTTTC